MIPGKTLSPITRIYFLSSVLAALMIIAGCSSQVPGPTANALQNNTYIFLEHHTDSEYVESDCVNPHTDYSYRMFSFNASTGVLDLYRFHLSPQPEKTLNGSVILIYGKKITRHGKLPENKESTIVEAINSTPRKFTSGNYPFVNMTIDSIMADGTVAFQYDGQPIVLKPKEKWENITRKTVKNSLSTSANPDCTDEIVVTDRIYNSGPLDKKSAIIHG